MFIISIHVGKLVIGCQNNYRFDEIIDDIIEDYRTRGHEVTLIKDWCRLDTTK